MSVHRTKLTVRETGEVVDASLDDDLALNGLFDAEASWAPARIRLLQRCMAQGISQWDREWPQSLHWDWMRKASQLHGTLGSALSAHRFMGIECGGEWQGLLLGECVGHRSRTSPPPRDLVYVEYIEVAPWNWSLDPLGQRPRYRGIGLQLLEAAIRWSEQLGFKGRLGLHALPQAEDFYRGRCRMTDLGPDAAYHGLRYLEMTETQAANFLSGVEK